MAETRWLQTRRDDLISETLADETLVIDTATGVFFSLRGVASAAWWMLDGMATVSELRAAVIDRYGTRISVDDDLGQFVLALEADGLVTEASGPRTEPLRAPEDWPEQYTAPVVKKYDDMADLLLVDPIHDVADDTGWPDRRPESP